MLLRFLEYYEQRETNRLSQERLVFRFGPILAAHDRLLHVRAQRPLAPARAQHVQAHPCGDRRGASADIILAKSDQEDMS